MYTGDFRLKDDYSCWATELGFFDESFVGIFLERYRGTMNMDGSGGEYSSVAK